MVLRMASAPRYGKTASPSCLKAGRRERFKGWGFKPSIAERIIVAQTQQKNRSIAMVSMLRQKIRWSTMRARAGMSAHKAVSA
jgi:hypothetical protein